MLLLIFSFLFWWANDASGRPYLLLLILFAYFIAKAMVKQSGKKRKALLYFGCAVCLALLGAYKYNVMPGATPAGLSFVIFSLLSALIDLCHSRTQSLSLFEWLLYCAFFPKLLMGPIETYEMFDQEYRRPDRKADRAMLESGIRRFIIGLAKKLLIADVLAVMVNELYDTPAPVSTGAAWLAACGYALQLYYDWSGYCDMGIGTARMLGWNLPENFNYPFVSQSASEIWRRWHITLGAWFARYIYIPLGGSRKGKLRTCMNLLIVFVLTGLWHGSGRRYLVWGLFFALFDILERGKLGAWLKKNPYKWINILYADLVFVIGFVIFRCDSFAKAVSWYGCMFTPQSAPYITAYSVLNRYTLFILIIAVLGCAPLPLLYASFKQKYPQHAARFHTAENILLLLLFAISAAACAGSTFHAFIYAQF